MEEILNAFMQESLLSQIFLLLIVTGDIICGVLWLIDVIYGDKTRHKHIRRYIFDGCFYLAFTFFAGERLNKILNETHTGTRTLYIVLFIVNMAFVTYCLKRDITRIRNKNSSSESQ